MSSETDRLLIQQIRRGDSHAWDDLIARGIASDLSVDFVDEQNTFSKGHFALQQHDPKSVVQVRKIEVKEIKK